MEQKKQIDEMAGILLHNEQLNWEIVDAVKIATVLCNADYRKQGETANEIFEEMGRHLTIVEGHPGLYVVSEADLAELRTKYIREQGMKLTKSELQKLHTLYKQSDLDMLFFLRKICDEEDKPEVELLIYLNDTVGIGYGEPSSPEHKGEFIAREEEYFSRKFALLSKYDSAVSWE